MNTEEGGKDGLNRVLVLDGTFDPDASETGGPARYVAIICLFWAAPATRAKISEGFRAPCYALADIVQGEMQWGKQVYDFIRPIVEGGPKYRNIPVRSYLEEALYRESHPLCLLVKVAGFIEELGRLKGWTGIEVDARLSERVSSALRAILSERDQISYRPILRDDSGPPGRVSVFGRLRRRFGEAALTGEWRTQAFEFLEWIDKDYALRCRLGPLMRSHVERGGITCFSSYSNNSRTISRLIGQFRLTVDWVVTNFSAATGIPQQAKNRSWIWRFAADELSQPGQIMTEDSMLAETHSGDAEARQAAEWATSSGTWEKWRAVEFRLLARLTSCWEAYLEQASPRLIVMANQWGIERWFTQIARARGIPVLQAMHGVLGGYLYTQTPIISDVVVTYGEFWRELWPADQRHKMISLAPQSVSRPTRHRVPARRLTFFSWPLNNLEFYNAAELSGGFNEMFAFLIGIGMAVTVRAHPLENPRDFVARWKEKHGALPGGLKVVKSESLERTLDDTDMALMFRSTVMLDCLARGIPVLMPGWIDFSWNDALRGLPCVYLARDFDDLRDQLLNWRVTPPETGDRSRFIQSGSMNLSALEALFTGDILVEQPL
jgi:hypothetical protein